MDKNEMSEVQNELSGKIIAIGQHIGTQNHVDDLETLGESLLKAHDELMIIIRVMKSK